MLRRIGVKCHPKRIQNSTNVGAAAVAESSLKGTVLLPKTDMPTRPPAAAALELFHKKFGFDGLYEWQREHLKGPDFILHDGPPYANGDPHMGHAVNKIVKDIINRNHVMNGRRVHYVPGWDCHGLPIELKALSTKKHNVKAKSLKPVELRKIAKIFAFETIAKQKVAFKSWGVMADWNKQFYMTLDKNYVQKQIRHFFDLFEKGLVYRDMKPVYWSPSSGTALAEAELEYNPNYESTQIYLTLPLIKIPDEIKSKSSDEKVHAVIWTTTPWSLVGNQAICYAENLEYSLLRDTSNQRLLIVASSLVSSLEETCNKKFNVLHKFQGNVLSSASYQHPLKNDMVLPFLPADHVSSEKGTGLVHTAPAHGPEDFLVALKNNMKIECYVNNEGNFENYADWLDGLAALSDGQKKIVEFLNNKILYKGSFVHSYPLDWRTKKPVIIKASSQWFIDTNAIRDKALKALESVNILPLASSKQHRQNFVKQLENRPYWCISRQRLWGVPIPVFYYKDKPVINKDTIDNICQLIDKEGTDCWWLAPVDKIVSESLLKENNITIDQLEKGQDIMDIWLDSGLSWSNVLDSKTADVYLEGLDQFTGWFQSSLMTSVALTGNAPYKNIYVHGFVVDSNGRKMSKSLGNITNPESIIFGGKNLQLNPAYGVDTLRWWVAKHSTQDTQIVISKHIMNESHAELIKLRLLIKFLLGCIHDLKPEVFSATNPAGYLDLYMLHLLYKYEKEVKTWYDDMNFSKICLSTLYFTTNHISGMYCHAAKDRLYCDGEDALTRRSSQTVMNHILMSMFRCLAPIVPHLIEEGWNYHPFNVNKVPFFKTPQDNIKPIWERVYIEMLMDIVFDIKKDVNKLCKGRNTLEFGVTLKANPEKFDQLMLMQSSETSYIGDLCDILHVSRVKLVEGKVHEDELSVSVEEMDKKLCKRCRKFTSNNANEPCERCQQVVDGIV